MRHTRQSGSALFVILIAIALFAALSYSFTQGSRTNQSQLTDQQVKMAAQEIVSYGNTIADMVQKLKLQGCTNSQYDVSNSAWVRYDNTTLVHPVGQNAGASANCTVFGAGKAVAQSMSPNFIDLSYPFTAASTKAGSWNMVRESIPGIGDAGSDELVLRLPFVKKEICILINNMVGITNPSGNPPGMTGSLGGLYVGGLGVSPSNAPVADTDNAITGKNEFCVRTNPSGVVIYEYQRVLIGF